MTGSRILEINVMSADDLKNATMFSKMNVYAVVIVSRTIQTTSVDRECGKKPVWNQWMRFNIDEAAAMHNNLNVIFRLKSNGGCFGESDLGEAIVPVKEMLSVYESQSQNNNGEQEERPQTYNLTKPGGRTKGTLNITYKFGPPAAPAPAANGFENPGMAIAYPPPPKNHPGAYLQPYSQGGYALQQDYNAGAGPCPSAYPPQQQGGGYRTPEHAGNNNPAYAPRPVGYPHPNLPYPLPGVYPPPGGYAPNVPFQGPIRGFNYPPPPPGYDNGAVRPAAPAPGPAPVGSAAPGGYNPHPVADSGRLSPPPPQQQQNYKNKKKNNKKAMAAGMGFGVLGGIAGGLALADADVDEEEY